MSKMFPTLESIDFDKANSLTNNKLFRALGKKHSRTFLSRAQRKNAVKGEVLQIIGEPQKSIIIVESGRIEKDSNGKKYILEAGDVSGLLHFFNEEPAASSLKVLEDTTFIHMDSLSFRILCDENKGFNSSFIGFLSNQVRERSNLLNQIAFHFKQSDIIKVAFFDCKPYIRIPFEHINKIGGYNFQFVWISERLSGNTCGFAAGSHVVCIFVNDVVDKVVVSKLSDMGIRMITLRCAGFDNIDLEATQSAGISVTRVPAYSPYAVAEFAISLLLACNRKVHKTWNRVREYNFSLSGLVGFDIHGKTAGIIGTGKIGLCTINILLGFGCKILCYDVYKNPEVEKLAGARYVESLDELWKESDIISLHAPLLESTYHIINHDVLEKCKDGVVIVNTSRGGLINSQDLLDALKSGKVGAAGLDVYEGEKGLFFEDRSEQVMPDLVLSSLIACHNVCVTSHQAFLTKEALDGITRSVLDSIVEFKQGKEGLELQNAVKG